MDKWVVDKFCMARGPRRGEMIVAVFLSGGVAPYHVSSPTTREMMEDPLFWHIVKCNVDVHMYRMGLCTIDWSLFPQFR